LIVIAGRREAASPEIHNHSRSRKSFNAGFLPIASVVMDSGSILRIAPE
jgi:hypothetical protein